MTFIVKVYNFLLYLFLNIDILCSVQTFQVCLWIIPILQHFFTFLSLLYLIPLIDFDLIQSFSKYQYYFYFFLNAIAAPIILVEEACSKLDFFQLKIHYYLINFILFRHRLILLHLLDPLINYFLLPFLSQLHQLHHLRSICLGSSFNLQSLFINNINLFTYK